MSHTCDYPDCPYTPAPDAEEAALSRDVVEAAMRVYNRCDANCSDAEADELGYGLRDACAALAAFRERGK